MSGMLFTLKKRIQCIRKNDDEYYQYKLFGYYDGLEINVVNEWYNFRPKGLEVKNLQVDLKSPFIDQYTIRAIVPNNTEQLVQNGFAYGLWNQIGAIESKCFEEIKSSEISEISGKSDTIQQVREKFPFLCISMINLTENFVKEQDDLNQLQSSVIGAVRESILAKGGYSASQDALSEMRDAVRELHCAVYASLGYSDFIILFLTDQIKKVADVIGGVRGSTIENRNGEKIKIISNCYSICGLDRAYLSSSNSGLLIEEQSDACISIRMNLKKGISTTDFLTILRSEFDRRLENGSSGEEMAELQELGEELTKCYYTTFGSSDCLFLPQKPLQHYLKLHQRGHILDPSEEFFKRYLAAVRTSVRVKGDGQQKIFDGYVTEEGGSEESDYYSEYESKFDEFIGMYDEYLKEGDRHIRSSKALQRLMKNFANVAQYSHGFDMRHILGSAFSSMIESLRYYINSAKESSKSVDEAGKIMVDPNRQLVIRAVEIFQDFIDDFMADLIRSDRPFIEGDTLTHPAIGSATKMVFSYNAMLEKIVEQYGQKKISFVVLSGGCDKTSAIDLFSFAHVDDNIKKLVLITVPEMSLYDVQGTLFRLLHECMHFVGDRLRGERYVFVIDAIAESMAYDICRIHFSSKEIKDFKEHILIYASGRIRSRIERQIEQVYDECTRNATRRISEIIKQQEGLLSYGEEKEPRALYARSLREEILSSVQFAKYFRFDFSRGEIVRDGALWGIYQILLEEDMKLLELLCEKLEELLKDPCLTETEKNRVSITYRLCQSVKQNTSFNIDKPAYIDQRTMRFLQEYIFSFFGSRPVFRDEDYEMVTCVYEDIREIILLPMIECFADCTSIKILNMDKVDFLLAFIYELWDISEAFPDTDDNVLRLGADLAVAYNIKMTTDRELSEFMCELRREVMRKVGKREKHGYRYQNVDEMLSRIEEILRQYSRPEYRGMIVNLEKYLRECLNQRSSWEFQELVELYSLSEMEANEGVYGMINKIICIWKGL